MAVALEQETDLWGYDLTLAQPPVASQCDWACLSESTFVLGNVYYCLEMSSFKEWIVFIFNLKCNMHPPLSRASYHCLCHVCSHNRLGLWIFYSHLSHRHFEWNNSRRGRSLEGEWGLSVLSLLKKQTLTCPFAANLILQHILLKFL